MSLGKGKRRDDYIYKSEYLSWCTMRARCRNPNEPGYKRYGGRGICICDRWDSFEAFLEDMGPKPGVEYSIDRIDNNGNYEPLNCRWATHKEQGNNTRTNRLITFNGETKTVMQWSEEIGLGYYTLWKRIDAGWSIEAAITTPRVPNNLRPGRAVKRG